ncbi:MAG: hypothetical protein JWO11_1435 [Nocardioides sp.]|nr:hypothetical protein [Nocardioides sp.]
MRKFHALAALTLGLSLVLTACGSDDKTASNAPSPTQHNAADVTFATQMIQHHAQALAMVDLTMGRDLDPQVQKLAEQIREAQAPEIETMVGWLTDWNEPIPATVRDHVNSEGHDMGNMGGSDMPDMGTDMPGMMSDADMTALENASAAEFQGMWLTMMIAHHQGAVQMAAIEEADGRYQPAIDLAKQIQRSQTAEIDTMKNLVS